MTAPGYYDESYPPSVYATPGPIDPHITSLLPATGEVDVEAVVQVIGTDFDDTAEVEVDQGSGQTLVPSVFVSPTRVTVTFTPTVVGEALFTLRNQSNDEESNPMPFDVTA
jgi:hypothetical protein